jgi:hypothetical protein
MGGQYRDLDKKRKTQREWVAARRAEWFNKNGPCKHCGSALNLELHHVDRSQKKSHSVFSWSKERRDKELEKCIVLCSVCHALETKKQWATDIDLQREIHHIHGTNTEYRRGCRCEPCKQAKYLEIAKYRGKL